MSKRKSFAIGAFIVGAFLLVFIALLFFSGGQLFSPKERVIMYFDGSVQGLQVGAPIKLKGVVLGEISDIQINFQTDDQPLVTAVTAEIVMKRIISKGTRVSDDFFTESIGKGLRAQLNFQSFLTGLLYVELDFFPDSPAYLYNIQDDLLEIPTVATDFEELSKNLQELNVKGLVSSLDSLAKQFNSIVASGNIEKTLGSIDRAANAVEKNADSFGKDIDDLNKNLSLTSTELTQLLKTLNNQTPEIAKNLNTNLVKLQQSLDQFTQATQTISHTFSEDAPLANQLNKTLEDISESARAFRSLSETLEQQPEAVWRGKASTDEEK